MSSFWHWYIWIIAIGSIGLLFWLISATRKVTGSTGDDEVLDHSYDGIQEYNNPLPAWWLYMFWGAMVYGLGYYAYFGLGNWHGFSGWTSHKQLEQEIAAHDKKYGDIFDRYAAMSIEDLQNEPRALQMGKRIFLNNCALCHGSAATGGYGFPNLTDNDWLYNDANNSISQTIHKTVSGGRRGQMPAWGQALGAAGVNAVANYVLSLSGNEHDQTLAMQGKALFMTSCVACHGVDGKGNQVLGAPNLTDNVWLYRNDSESLLNNIKLTINNGRAGNMPAWNSILGSAKVQLVSAYVYSLSH